MTFQERYKYNPTTDFLGKGGFARVYKATDTLLDREVAIKIFNATDQNHYTVVEEIKKVIKLKHPNLLTYYDVEVIEHTTPLGEKEVIQIGVMELANAGDLKQFAMKNANSPKLFQLLQQVLSGLEYLHQKGIIHRDLKPQNILLLEEDGELTAKISDFGISKNLDSGTNSSSMAIGTIEYMAPEQFNPAKYGINGKISTNVDLWSFGIMVHELLTNESLFGQRDGSTTAEQIMSAILSNELPSNIDTLPEPFRTATKKCLVKNARERIQKAREVISLLEGKEQLTPQPAASITNETVIIPKQYFDAQETSVLPNASSVETQVFDKKKESNVTKHTETWKKKLTLVVVGLVLSIGIWWVINKNKADFKQPLYTINDSLINNKDSVLETIYTEMVRVGNFSISKYEITQAQWVAVMDSNLVSFKGGNLPIEQVNWDEVQMFIKKLNSLTSKSYRLPTEVEWEFASKGGNQSHNYTYSGGNDINAVAWWWRNSNWTTHPVGQKQPNELGIYDMSGNVWEWCSDSLFKLCVRGGSWSSDSDECRSFTHGEHDHSVKSGNLGFRLALTLSTDKADNVSNRKKITHKNFLLKINSHNF